MIQIAIVMLFSLIAITGCGGSRDLSSPEKALLGHWITEDEKIEYYFREETFITVDHERQGKQEFEHHYFVLESDNEKNWLRTGVSSSEDAEIVEEDDWELYRDIVISQNGTFLYEAIFIVVPEKGDEEGGLLRPGSSTKWIYVDDKRAPSN